MGHSTDGNVDTYEASSTLEADAQVDTTTSSETDKVTSITKALSTEPQVWAVGGGKGGVGKSLVAANLAFCLSQMGKKVVAVDLDLGCANLHTCLGANIPTHTLTDFFTKRSTHVRDLLSPVIDEKLYLISGAQDALGVANLKHPQKLQLLSQLRSLNFDHIIFDLGAGTSFNTLDFFLAAQVGILVLLPEPTSIENTYRFLKCAYYRKLKLCDDLFEVRPLIDMAMDQHNPLNIQSPHDLLREIRKIDPKHADTMQREIAKMRPRLVVNQIRTQSDIDIGYSIRSVSKKYFGIDIEYLGYLEHDNSVWQAVRRRKPVSAEFPNSRLVSNFDRITKYLVNQKVYA